MNALLAIVILLEIGGIILLVVLVKRKHALDLTQVTGSFENLAKAQERTDRLLRDELVQNRNETSANSLQARQELQTNLQAFNSSLQTRMTEIATLQKNQLELFANQLSGTTTRSETKLTQMREAIENRLMSLAESNARAMETLRGIVDQKLKEIGRFMRLQGLYAVEAFLLAYLARVLGHSLEHTQMIIEGMKREICDPKLQLYNTHRFIYGRKPQNR